MADMGQPIEEFAQEVIGGCAILEVHGTDWHVEGEVRPIDWPAAPA